MEIAHRFEALGLPVVGVPKTIDNDLFHTDRTFGFDSAVAVVAESLDRLRTTAKSHGRVMIAETMGRHAGWIALEGGIAGGADAILLPEVPFTVDALAAFCRAREAQGLSTLVSLAEGIHPAGAGAWLQAALQPQLKSEVRHVVLGHLQRGGAPTAFDRVLSTRFGYAAAQLVKAGDTGRMVTLQGNDCASVPIASVAGRNRLVPPDHALVQAARGLGAFVS
jgi:6-phosphofructokinase 1